MEGGITRLVRTGSDLVAFQHEVRDEVRQLHLRALLAQHCRLSGPQAEGLLPRLAALRPCGLERQRAGRARGAITRLEEPHALVGERVVHKDLLAEDLVTVLLDRQA